MVDTVWTWTFRNAKVANEDGLTDVIKSVGYELKGTRGSAVHVIGGETGLGAPDPENFTPFASLNEAQMIAILGTSVNIDALKTQIDAWHDEEIKPLPFGEEAA